MLKHEGVQSSVEHVLTEEKTKLEAIFASCPDAITVSDLKGTIVECNQVTLDLGEFSSKDEVIGKNALEFIAEKDRERAMENLKKTLQQGSVRNIEYTLLTKNGREYPAELSATVIKDSSGNPTGFVAVTRDITERKQREERLIRLSNTVTMSTDSIVISDLNGTIIDANDATLKMYGAENKRELIGKNSFDLIVPEDREKALAGMKEVLEKGYVKGQEYHIITKDGGRIPVEMNTAIMKDADGKPIGFVGISRDITARKKKEEALWESEGKLSAMLRSIGDHMSMMDEDLNILWANETAKKIFGDDIIGKKCYEVYHRRKKPCEPYPCLTLKTFQDGKTHKHDTQVIGKDGKLIYFHCTANVALRDKEGKPTAVIEISRDITEHVEAERALRESEQKFRDLTETTTDWIWEVNEDGVYVYVNPKVKELLGYEVSEVLGKTPFDFMPEKEAERVGRILREKVVNKEPLCELENTNQHKDGRLVFLETSGIPIFDEKGRFKGYRGIDRDITERKKMERQLWEYTEHLKEIVEERTRELVESQERLVKSERLAAVGKASAMVAHDLRNPLQAIENAGYYLKNELSRVRPSGENFKTVLEMLQIISSSVDYADGIVRGLHDFSVTKKLILKKTDVNALVKEVLSQVEPPENVKLITELQRLPELNMDKHMVKRVLMNLAENGIQAMKMNGGKLKVSTKKTKGFVEVSFEDTGVGVSKENMKNLFVPFFTTKAQGLGLGLPICKKFMERHGGSIQVESEEGKGSTFTVKLPIQKENGGEKLGKEQIQHPHSGGRQQNT